MIQNSSHIIKDGTGSGNKLKVNEDGSLIAKCGNIDNAEYLITISSEHYRLHNGQAYSATSILGNLNGNTSTYIEFIIPNKMVSFQGFNLVTDRFVKTDFYELPTVTDGTTEIPIINRRRSSTNVSTTKIYTNPTAVSGGILLRTLVFGNISGQANTVRALQPSGVDSYGFNLKPNTKYALKITNLSADATTILYFNLDLYEY